MIFAHRATGKTHYLCEKVDEHIRKGEPALLICQNEVAINYAKRVLFSHGVSQMHVDRSVRTLDTLRRGDIPRGTHVYIDDADVLFWHMLQRVGVNEVEEMTWNLRQDEPVRVIDEVSVEVVSHDHGEEDDRWT